MESSAIVQVSNLQAWYGERRVLRGLSFAIEPGQVLGYLGPNGAGKTTTIKVLSGQLDSARGIIRVCGWDPRTHPLEVKQRIGYVPEGADLYEWLTPLEYLELVGRVYQMPARRAVRRSHEVLEFLGLLEQSSDRITSFSKGMKQKLNLAAGILHEPKLLFLDEPLSGLDVPSSRSVRTLVAQLAESGTTVIYCSHILDIVEKVCDRVIILAEGLVVHDQSVGELEGHGSLEELFLARTTPNKAEGAMGAGPLKQ